MKSGADLLSAPSGEPVTESRGRAALWLGVLAIFATLVLAYVFAFRAVHAAQIREVPLAPGAHR